MILQNHRRLPVSIFSVKIAALGSLNRLLEGFSKLLSNLKGTTLRLLFSLNKKQKIVKTISAFTKSTYLLL